MPCPVPHASREKHHFRLGYEKSGLGLSIIIFASMIFAVAMASVAGALVPSFLARFGQDPAMASSIILSTITDVVGFLIISWDRDVIFGSNMNLPDKEGSYEVS